MLFKGNYHFKHNIEKNTQFVHLSLEIINKQIIKVVVSYIMMNNYSIKSILPTGVLSKGFYFEVDIYYVRRI